MRLELQTPCSVFIGGNTNGHGKKNYIHNFPSLTPKKSGSITNPLQNPSSLQPNPSKARVFRIPRQINNDVTLQSPNPLMIPP